MNKIINLVLALMLISSTFVYSQENPPPYFGEIRSIPVYNPTPLNTIGHMRFDLSEVVLSNNRLDLATTSNLNYLTDTRWDHWNTNNGNGYFGSPNQFYWGDQSSGEMKDILFVQLKDGNYPKDLVVIKGNGLQVHQNTNNAISGIYQSLSNGNGNFADAGGAFDYWDTREDVAITTGNQIKIFRNTGSGTLDPNCWTFSNISGSKVKLRQMTDKNRQEIQISENDRADLIVYNGSNIKVYKNHNDNTFEATPIADYNVGFTINDIEIADINGDEYNDIIVVGNNIGQGFLNAGGYYINSTPSWNVSGISYNPLVTTADVNKDGFKDIITVGYEGYTKVFVSTNINTSAQSFYTSDPYFSVECIKAVDVHNTGGISLLVSYTGSYGSNHYYGIKLVLPTTSNPAPPPPIIDKQYILDGSVYRPKLVLNNRSERDFNHYEIWKKGVGANDFSLYANVTNNYFIDYNEYIIFSGGDNANTDNCFYFAKCVDATNLPSNNSSQIGYRVGLPYCSECVSDNQIESMKNPKPDKFQVTNFPNPFNPATKIIYSLPADAKVTIVVYNILGKEITRLVNNEHKKSGMYMVEFNGSNLTSGVYYYRIQADNFVQVKRMVLIK